MIGLGIYKCHRHSDNRIRADISKCKDFEYDDCFDESTMEDCYDKCYLKKTCSEKYCEI